MRVASIFIASLFGCANALSKADLQEVQLEVEKLIYGRTASNKVSSCSGSTFKLGCCRKSFGGGPSGTGGGSDPSGQYFQGCVGGSCGGPGGTGWGSDAMRGHTVAGMVRLAFHDPATYNVANGWGGVNGCIDFKDPDNAGLEGVVADLKTIQETLAKRSTPVVISTADLYQYAALVAIWCSTPTVVKSTKADNVVPFPFKWGRKQELSCSYYDPSGPKYESNRLPRAELAFVEIDGLKNRWGMSYQDISALMGGHCVGSMVRKNSGYSPEENTVRGQVAADQGHWVGKFAVFNGQAYYNALINIPWDRQVNGGGDKHSWIRVGGTMMLNTDMALFFDIENNRRSTDNDNAVNNGNQCRKAGGPGAQVAVDAATAPGGCPIYGVNSARVAKANALTVNKYAITGGTTDVAKVAKGGTAGKNLIVDTRELIQEYSDSTLISSSAVFNGGSTVGQDAWFPDFMAAFQRLSELGAGPALQDPCNPGECKDVPDYLGQTSTDGGKATTDGGGNSIDGPNSIGGNSVAPQITGPIIGAVAGVVVLLVFAVYMIARMRRQRSAASNKV
jgi:hypothetical protein